MRTPRSMWSLEALGRVRLSKHFYMRDFLMSEISAFHGIPNIPDDPDLAIKHGQRLCQDLLDPLEGTFGRIAIRSGYRRTRSTPMATRTSSIARAAITRLNVISGTTRTALSQAHRW